MTTVQNVFCGSGRVQLSYDALLFDFKRSEGIKSLHLKDISKTQCPRSQQCALCVFSMEAGHNHEFAVKRVS